MKLIKIVDYQGNVLGDTYTKRAKQLVKNKRAVWVSDELICLVVENYKEDKEMNDTQDVNSNMENIEENNFGNGPRPLLGAMVEETSSDRHDGEKSKLCDEFEDKLLLEKAKNRMAHKRRLISEAFAFAFTIFMMVLISVAAFNGAYYETRQFFLRPYVEFEGEENLNQYSYMYIDSHYYEDNLGKYEEYNQEAYEQFGYYPKVLVDYDAEYGYYLQNMNSSGAVFLILCFSFLWFTTYVIRVLKFNNFSFRSLKFSRVKNIGTSMKERKERELKYEYEKLKMQDKNDIV